MVDGLNAVQTGGFLNFITLDNSWSIFVKVYKLLFVKFCY